MHRIESPKKREHAALGFMRREFRAHLPKIFHTDFTVHDVYALSHLSDDQPFLWAIYEHGTHLFRTTNEKLARECVRGLGAWWRLYAWDGSKLILIDEK